MIRRLLKRIRAIVGQLLPGGDIVSRTIKSGMWLSVMNVSDRFLQLGLVVILANLLSPAAFGLLGIALFAKNALMRFTTLGIDQSLIQQADENVDEYLNTVWCLKAARGLIIATLTFLAAPFVAGAFGEPEATNVIRVIGVSAGLTGLVNPGILYFRKNLEFHKQFVYNLSGSFLNFVIALGVALLFTPTVWALVIGYAAADLTRLIVSYLLHSYRPRPSFSRERAREMIGYGKWITGTKILHFIINEGDDAVVALVLNATSLGFYQMAYRLARAPSTEITHVISQVTFPAYSKLQENISELREGFFRTVQVTTFLSFPVGAGILVVTPVFVEGFMGADWMPMVTTMQILALYGFFVSMAATFGPVWKTIGRPDYLAKLALYRLALSAIVIFPAVNRYGIEGAAAVVAGIWLVFVMPLDIHLVIKSVETTYRRFIREVTYPFVASVAMGLAVEGAKRSLTISSPQIEFFVLVLVGIVSYLLAVILIETQFEWGMQQNARMIIDAVR